MIIPFNLFPRRKAQLNTKWGNDTYKYYSMFNPDVMLSDNPSKEEVINWLLFSKELFDSIKAKAQERIMKEIVIIANRYQLQTLKKTKIVSFDDIIRLYKNKQWYFSKLQNHRDYLYIFQYGLLRSGTDMWVDDVVGEFVFKKYNVVYEKLEVKGKKKGCFHKLVLNAAGDYISSRLQRVCTKYLGEYVCSRCPNSSLRIDNKNSEIHKNQIVIPHIFFNYHKGYIVKLEEDWSSLDKVDMVAKQLIEVSKKFSVTLTELQEKIKDYWDDNGKNIYFHNKTLDEIYINIYFYLFYI